MPLRRPLLRLAASAVLTFSLLASASLQRAADTPPETLVWRLDSTTSVGGHATEVIGAPGVVDGAVTFNGKSDGLMLAVNPLAGWKAFTVELCFRPDEDGPAEQRFFHAQDKALARALVEIRLNGQGSWWLDTYLMKPPAEGLPLIDPKRRHPTARWHWVALRFDGKTMAHFVNGEKEREGEVVFGPMEEGKLSLGVRQNLIHWFKGAIREVRLTPEALPEEKLQRMPK